MGIRLNFITLLDGKPFPNFIGSFSERQKLIETKL
jgi:hypothetical protein